MIYVASALITMKNIRINVNLGIDIGTVSIGIALIKNEKVIKTDYKKHEGNITNQLSEMLKNYPLSDIKRVGITGSGEEKVNKSFKRIDQIICFIEGTKHLNPSIKNIIFIGGESFGLIELNEKGRYKNSTGKYSQMGKRSRT